MTTAVPPYAARLKVDYPQRLNRLTTFLRLVWAIPILAILALLSAADGETMVNEAGEVVQTSGLGITGGLFLATALMIVVRERYPRWWFDFARELTRFSNRVGAYLALLSDSYPSTSEEQSIHL
jgi:hypothetical protein